MKNLEVCDLPQKCKVLKNVLYLHVHVAVASMSIDEMVGLSLSSCQR